MSVVLIACGSPTETDEPPLAAISLNDGIPVYVAAGSTYQLTIELWDENMQPTTQQVRWRSSNEAVAKVSEGGLVAGIAPGLADITASGGGQSATTTAAVFTRVSIGPAGGVIALPNGSTAVIPAGALSEPSMVAFGPGLSGPVTPVLVPGTVHHFGEQLLSFTVQPTLTIAFDPARVPAGIAVGSLQLAYLSGGAWHRIAGSTVDAAARKVTARVPNMRQFAIVGTGATASP